jgi:hypothetical protein
MKNAWSDSPALAPSASNKDTDREVRPLTHDERKAAEAAFRGEPFHPAWSHAARQIYDGISAAMVRMETRRLLSAKRITETDLLDQCTAIPRSRHSTKMLLDW